MSTPRMRVRLAVAGLALGGMVLCVAPSDAHATVRANVPWQLVWRDDFAGPAGAGPSGDWLVDLGHSYPGGPANWGTGEVQAYTADPANLSLDGHGDLRVTATRDLAGAWRSGRVETVRSDFQPPAGGRLRIEARIQLPGGGKGYWPAFWAIGAPFRVSATGYPAQGEIDVTENIDNESTVHGTLHCGQPVGGPCREGTGLTGAYRLGTPAGSAGFHVYAVEWNERQSRLDWYVDNTRYWSVGRQSLDAATWTRTFGHGYFLLLNLAIGGSWPGFPDASTQSGRSMLVDYVAVLRANGSA